MASWIYMTYSIEGKWEIMYNYSVIKQGHSQDFTKTGVAL